MPTLATLATDATLPGFAMLGGIVAAAIVAQIATHFFFD